MLPTVEECRTFFDLVNAGRAAANLEPLAVLDFDGSMPGCTQNCLAARNLFYEVGYTLSARGTWPRWGEPPNLRVLEALGVFVYDADAEHDDLADGYGMLPAAIQRVVYAFDNQEGGLRERMVEAGVVAP